MRTTDHGMRSNLIRGITLLSKGNTGVNRLRRKELSFHTAGFVKGKSSAASQE